MKLFNGKESNGVSSGLERPVAAEIDIPPSEMGKLFI
jgi:hypothetical protein